MLLQRLCELGWTLLEGLSRTYSSVRLFAHVERRCQVAEGIDDTDQADLVARSCIRVAS